MRAIRLGLTICLLLGNCVFAHALETNFWKERLASLSSPVLRQLPPLSALVRSSSPRPSTPDSRWPLLKSIPAALGTIRHSAAPSSSKVVLHIQDVHLNPEAQGNIGQAVAALIESGHVDLIALEGVFGPIDLDSFRSFPQVDTIQKVSDHLLREKKISGPIHAALTTRAALPPLVGVDDETHYQANVEAYRQSIALVLPLKKKLAAHKISLARDKEKSFNPLLKDFDAQVEAFRSGAVQLGDFAKRIAKEEPDISTDLEIFLEALNLEATLNFTAVEDQRSRLLAALVSRLTAEEMSTLAAVGAAFRLGTIAQSEFYNHLEALCRRNGVSLSRFPSLNAYIQYVLLSERIHTENVLSDLRNIEQRRYAALAQTPREGQIIAASHRLYLTEKLVDFSLSSEEWQEYKRARTTNYEPFERFYELAELRDRAMSANLQTAIKKHNAKTAVLVTGGFHSKGIEKAVNEPRTTNVSFISFIPRISKVETTDGSSYLSVFAQEKAPLETLFEGEKLFLSPIAWSSSLQQYTALLFVAYETMRGRLMDAAATFKTLAVRSAVQIKNAVLNGESVDLQLATVGGNEVVFHVDFNDGDFSGSPSLNQRPFSLTSLMSFGPGGALTVAMGWLGFGQDKKAASRQKISTPVNPEPPPDPLSEWRTYLGAVLHNLPGSERLFLPNAPPVRFPGQSYFKLLDFELHTIGGAGLAVRINLRPKTGQSVYPNLSAAGFTTDQVWGLDESGTPRVDDATKVYIAQLVMARRMEELQSDWQAVNEEMTTSKAPAAGEAIAALKRKLNELKSEMDQLVLFGNAIKAGHYTIGTSPHDASIEIALAFPTERTETVSSDELPASDGSARTVAAIAAAAGLLALISPVYAAVLVMAVVLMQSLLPEMGRWTPAWAWAGAPSSLFRPRAPRDTFTLFMSNNGDSGPRKAAPRGSAADRPAKHTDIQALTARLRQVAQNFDYHLRHRAKVLLMILERDGSGLLETSRGEISKLLQAASWAANWKNGWLSRSTHYSFLAGRPVSVYSLEGRLSAAVPTLERMANRTNPKWGLDRLTTAQGGLGDLVGGWISALARLGFVTLIAGRSDAKAPEAYMFMPDYQMGMRKAKVDPWGVPLMDWADAAWSQIRPAQHGLSRVMHPKHKDVPLTVPVPVHGIGVVNVQFHAVPYRGLNVIMMDTDNDANDTPLKRGIFAKLYQGRSRTEERFRQQWVYAIAAQRFKEEMRVADGPVHLNETATFPILIGKIKSYTERYLWLGYSLQEAYQNAMEITGRETVFFTHTLENAGLDLYWDHNVPIGAYIKEYFETSFSHEQASLISEWMVHGRHGMPGLFFTSPNEGLHLSPLNFILKLVYKFGGQAVAVSRLNAQEAGKFFSSPDYPVLTAKQVQNQPVAHVTNAVDEMYFQDPLLQELMKLDEPEPRNRRPHLILNPTDEMNLPLADHLQYKIPADFKEPSISDADLTAFLSVGRERVVQEARRIVKAQYKRNILDLASTGHPAAVARLEELKAHWSRWTGQEFPARLVDLDDQEFIHLLDPTAPITTTARRVVPYKRILLVLFGSHLPQAEQLLKISDEWGGDIGVIDHALDELAREKGTDLPGLFKEFIDLIENHRMQFLFAGPVFGPDGRKLVATVNRVIERLAITHPLVAQRAVYLEGYDDELSPILTNGSDVWLNVPERPREASGTSGMKGSAVPVTVLDGWAADGVYDGLNGLAIRASADLPADHPFYWSQTDRQKFRGFESKYYESEAASLYGTLRSISDRFYNDRPQWLNLVRRAIFSKVVTYSVRSSFQGRYLPSSDHSLSQPAQELGIIHYYSRAAVRGAATKNLIALRRELQFAESRPWVEKMNKDEVRVTFRFKTSRPIDLYVTWGLNGNGPWPVQKVTDIKPAGDGFEASAIIRPTETGEIRITAFATPPGASKNPWLADLRILMGRHTGDDAMVTLDRGEKPTSALSWVNLLGTPVALLLWMALFPTPIDGQHAALVSFIYLAAVAAHEGGHMIEARALPRFFRGGLTVPGARGYSGVMGSASMLLLTTMSLIFTPHFSQLMPFVIISFFGTLVSARDLRYFFPRKLGDIRGIQVERRPGGEEYVHFLSRSQVSFFAGEEPPRVTISPEGIQVRRNQQTSEIRHGRDPLETYVDKHRAEIKARYRKIMDALSTAGGEPVKLALHFSNAWAFLPESHHDFPVFHIGERRGRDVTEMANVSGGKKLISYQDDQGVVHISFDFFLETEFPVLFEKLALGAILGATSRPSSLSAEILKENFERLARSVYGESIPSYLAVNSKLGRSIFSLVLDAQSFVYGFAHHPLLSVYRGAGEVDSRKAKNTALLDYLGEELARHFGSDPQLWPEELSIILSGPIDRAVRENWIEGSAKGAGTLAEQDLTQAVLNWWLHSVVSRPNHEIRTERDVDERADFQEFLGKLKRLKPATLFKSQRHSGAKVIVLQGNSIVDAITSLGKVVPEKTLMVFPVPSWGTESAKKLKGLPFPIVNVVHRVRDPDNIAWINDIQPAVDQVFNALRKRGLIPENEIFAFPDFSSHPDIAHGYTLDPNDLGVMARVYAAALQKRASEMGAERIVIFQQFDFSRVRKAKRGVPEVLMAALHEKYFGSVRSAYHITFDQGDDRSRLSLAHLLRGMNVGSFGLWGPLPQRIARLPIRRMPGETYLHGDHPDLYVTIRNSNDEGQDQPIVDPDPVERLDTPPAVPKGPLVSALGGRLVRSLFGTAARRGEIEKVGDALMLSAVEIVQRKRSGASFNQLLAPIVNNRVGQLYTEKPTSSHPFTSQEVEGLVSYLERRVIGLIEEGDLSVEEAWALAATLSKWIGRPVNVAGKEIILIARATDKGPVRELRRRFPTVRFTVIVAAESKADFADVAGIRVMGTNSLAGEFLNMAVLESELWALKADRSLNTQNAILSFSNQIHVTAVPEKVLAGSPFKDMSSATLEDLLGSLETVRVLSLQSLLSFARLIARQA